MKKTTPAPTVKPPTRVLQRNWTREQRKFNAELQAAKNQSYGDGYSKGREDANADHKLSEKARSMPFSAFELRVITLLLAQNSLHLENHNLNGRKLLALQEAARINASILEKMDRFYVEANPALPGVTVELVAITDTTWGGLSRSKYPGPLSTPLGTGVDPNA